jgi:hypothetical protein
MDATCYTAFAANGQLRRTSLRLTGQPHASQHACAAAVDPAWVDNNVNLMALGELPAGLARDETDVVYINIGSGISAGLISDGHLHRGAQGAAGDDDSVTAGAATPDASRRSLAEGAPPVLDLAVLELEEPVPAGVQAAPLPCRRSRQDSLRLPVAGQGDPLMLEPIPPRQGQLARTHYAATADPVLRQRQSPSRPQGTRHPRDCRTGGQPAASAVDARASAHAANPRTARRNRTYRRLGSVEEPDRRTV